MWEKDLNVLAYGLDLKSYIWKGHAYILWLLP